MPFTDNFNCKFRWPLKTGFTVHVCYIEIGSRFVPNGITMHGSTYLNLSTVVQVQTRQLWPTLLDFVFEVKISTPVHQSRHRDHSTRLSLLALPFCLTLQKRNDKIQHFSLGRAYCTIFANAKNLRKRKEVSKISLRYTFSTITLHNTRFRSRYSLWQSC